MPLAEPFDRLIDSPIADMKNVGPREGGSITAAQFIQRFVENGVRWAHIDMAGKAWSDKPSPTYDKGATGFGVRLLDQYVADVLEAWSAGRCRSISISSAATPAEQVIASIAEKVLAEDGRLLIVADDENSSPGSTACCGTRARPASFRTPSPAAPTMRASRSCCRPARMRPTSPATC